MIQVGAEVSVNPTLLLRIILSDCCCFFRNGVLCRVSPYCSCQQVILGIECIIRDFWSLTPQLYIDPTELFRL